MIIRWGPDASSDRFRQSARCRKCGAKGVILRHPNLGQHAGRVGAVSNYYVELRRFASYLIAMLGHGSMTEVVRSQSISSSPGNPSFHLLEYIRFARVRA
jgi:hypothetical protein